MNFYCIYGIDAAGSAEKRQALRDAHLAYLQALNKQGKLFAAEPLCVSDTDNTFCRSMIIVSFDSLEAAQAWWDQEPYHCAGVYAETSIHRYIDAMPYC